MAAAATLSPLYRGPARSGLADLDELRYREEIEPYPDPVAAVVAMIEDKELPRKLEYVLARADVRPAGTVVDLGAGTCWLAGTLAVRPEVERVIAVEFSARRLTELAPIALAHVRAPAEKVERRVADFYQHGLGDGFADLVTMDAAFHHAADPTHLARVAYDLLRPGGQVLLFREPTLSLLRRSRPHGEEDMHGSFEHEYHAGEYLGFLRAVGFKARKSRASGGFATPRARALLKPPLSWLSGILFSEYSYVGWKPDRVAPA